MLVPGDLGFRVAALLIFVIFPACFLYLRRKWRIAAARRDEINRLLVLASEEDAPAEIETSVGYSATYAAPSATYVAPSQRHCALCYIPARNRCARCKSVHYCSGKCQIIHWRQGHKDECHPSMTSFQNNEEAINFVEDSMKQPYPDSIENDSIPFTKQGDTASVKHGSSSEFSVKDDNDTVDDSARVKESGSLSGVELSSCDAVCIDQVDEPSSGDGKCIDESSSADDKCIDESTDDDSLHDLNSNPCVSCSTLDNLETSSSDKNVEQSSPLGEKLDTKVEGDGNLSAACGPTEVTVDIRNGSSDLSISADNNSAEPTVLVSGSDFWDGALESSRTKKYAHTNNAKTKSGRSDDRQSFYSRSSVQYSNMSCNLSSDLHLQGSGASTGTYPGTSRDHKLVEPTLLKESTDITRQRSSTVLSPKRLDVKSDGNLTKSGEVSSVGKSRNDNGSPSCGLNVANKLDRDNKETSPSLLSKKDGLSPKFSSSLSKKDGLSPKSSSSLSKKDVLSPEAPAMISSSGSKGFSAPTVKPVKASRDDTMAPQVTTSTASAAVGLKTSMLKVVEQLRAPKSSKQSEAVVRNNEKGVFPYDLFIKLYHWNKVELRPCGLINCGNSCYANVVLQCLAFTPPLTAYLLQGFHSKACVRKEWCFTCEFERLILKAKEGRSPLSPLGILSQIQKIGSHLAAGREEDAHEFLRYAIDTMQSACLQEVRGAHGSLEEETTLMGLTFGGYLRSKIKCTKCHGKSEKQERMMDLTVEIEGDIETLEDALRRFTGTESLDGENKYHCGRCKSYEKAKKKLSIVEAPNVLTIALKRFQSGKFGKLNKSIRFPEVLNLTPYMSGASDKSPIYRLYGVVVHLDVMNAAFSGHYVCYVRNSHKWYKIDDSMVKAVERDRVLNKGAYMLFYSRVSPRAPRSIRSSIISHDFSAKIKNQEVDPSQTTGRNTNLRHSLGDVHQGETSFPRNILDIDSSSDGSSLFSNSDEVSSSTDSNRDSISADDMFDNIFNGCWRHSSDSDMSSPLSCSSSSPLYTKHSSLSNPERYASTLSETSVSQSGNAHSVPVWDPSWAYTPRETCRAKEPGPGIGASFLQSNSSKQVRNLVNSSSCRGADSERLGWTNSLDNMNSGVHLRRSLRKKADEAFPHTVLS